MSLPLRGPRPRIDRLAATLVLGAALLAFVATSPPSASDEETGTAILSAAAPSVSREVFLDVDLQGAFDAETIDFSCGMAWAEGAEPTLVRVSVLDLGAATGAEAQTMQVLADIGTEYEDGSRSPGLRALVQRPIPCTGDARCTGHYRVTCDLPEPAPDREVVVEWRVDARVRYDPGGFCGDARTTLDLRSQEAAP